MAIKHYRMDETLEQNLEKANYVFAVIFNLECAFKLLGLGKAYFYQAWNLFDMLIVVGTDVGLILNLLDTGSRISTAATIVRAFRIMRIFRLIRSSKHIRIILDTLVNILP